MGLESLNLNSFLQDLSLSSCDWKLELETLVLESRQEKVHGFLSSILPQLCTRVEKAITTSYYCYWQQVWKWNLRNCVQTVPVSHVKNLIEPEHKWWGVVIPAIKTFFPFEKYLRVCYLFSWQSATWIAALQPPGSEFLSQKCMSEHFKGVLNICENIIKFANNSGCFWWRWWNDS